MSDSIIFYLSQYTAISSLTDEQIGKLFRALFEKQLGNEVVLTDDIKIAYNFINNQLVVDKNKYKKKCEKNRENGKKGGAPKGNKNAKKTTKQPKQPNGLKNNPNDNDNINSSSSYNNNKNIQLEGVIGGEEIKVINLFQSKGILYSNTPEEQNIIKYLAAVDEKLIEDCIEDALIKNKGSINYVFGIIRNKIRAAPKKEDNLTEKKTPVWFNQEPKKDEHGLEELGEILKDF